MARAAFTDVMGVYAGPGAPIPGLLKGIGMGRHVPQTEVQIAQGWFTASTSYFTTEVSVASAGVYAIVGGAILWDPLTADLIEFPFGSGIFFPVLTIDVITPTVGDPYYRINVA